jgi:hypothetical protein
VGLAPGIKIFLKYLIVVCKTYIKPPGTKRFVSETEMKINLPVERILRR